MPNVSPAERAQVMALFAGHLGVKVIRVDAEREFLAALGGVFRHPFPGPGLYDKPSQAFPVFLPLRSVGVMGDGRRYDYVIASRAVETTDFMTSQWARLPNEFIDLVARWIVKEVRGISRIVHDISGRPPTTIEWE